MARGQRGIEVTLNHATMRQMLNGDLGVRALLHEKAEKVLEAARASAPRDTGDYADSIHIEEAHTDRLAVRVVADDYKAGIIEARYGILASALNGTSSAALVKYTSKAGRTSYITRAQHANYTRAR